MTTPQWLLVGVDAFQLLFLLGIGVVYWRQKKATGSPPAWGLPTLAAAVPLLVGSVVATIAAWYQMAQPVLAIPPSPSASPTSIGAPPTIKVHDPGHALQRCALVIGSLGSAPGYAPAIGVRKVGAARTWYEVDMDVRADGEFTAQVELGDAKDKDKTYELVPILMPESSLKDLVEATRMATHDTGATHFGMRGLPTGAISGQYVKVTRRDDKPC